MGLVLWSFGFWFKTSCPSWYHSSIYHGFSPSEILPVVEFVLEEGISDEEAMHLIQQSGGNDSGNEDNSKANGEEEEEENHWKRSDSGNAQALTLDGGSPDPTDPSDDPFTANLMNFYVSITCLWSWKM